MGANPITQSNLTVAANSVQTSHIIDEAVTSAKLANNIAIDGALSVAGNTTLKGSLTLDGDSNDDTPGRPAVRFEFVDVGGTTHANNTITRLMPTADNGTSDHASTQLHIGTPANRFFRATHNAKFFIFQHAPNAGSFEIKRYGSGASLKVDSNGRVLLPDLPTSISNLSSGTLYRDGSGFLKVA